MAPIPHPGLPPDAAEDGPEGIPDLSHLSEEERQIILQVLQRQRQEEQKEEEIVQKGDRELWDIERQIQERKENAQRLIGTQDDAICQICQKTKFADGIGHKCFYCQLRSCARCGGKTTSKNKAIWACSLCQKRQQILARTGKWFHQQQQGQQTAQSQPQTTQPVTPMSPLSNSSRTFPPSIGDQQPRDQSTLAQSAADQPVDGAQVSGYSRQSSARQNSLHRQSSMEEQAAVTAAAAEGGRQSSIINGDRMGGPQRGNGGATAVGGGKVTEGRQQNGRRRGSSGAQQQAQRRGAEERQAAQGAAAAVANTNTNSRQHQQQQAAGGRQTQQGTEWHQQQQREQRRPSTGGRTAARSSAAAAPAPGTLSGGNSSSKRQRASTMAQDSLPNHLSQQQQQPRPSPRAAATAAASTGDHQRRSAASSACAPSSSSAMTTTVPAVPAVPCQPTAVVPSVSRATTTNVSSATTTNVSSATTTMGGAGPSPMRARRNKLSSRQMRSYSSSSDELSSPKLNSSFQQQHQQQSTTAQPAQVSATQQEPVQLGEERPEPDFTEKELLRYIYDNSQPSGSATKMTPAAARGSINFFGNNSQQATAHLLDTTKVAAALASGSSLPAGPSSHALARRIRNYLSNTAVSWQPSADQRRLIGHVVLQKPSHFSSSSSSSVPVSSASVCASLDFGLKVVGGRNPLTGRLGAFVSRVRSGSIADTVGQLRAGDEVLEWNGHPLQNVTPEGVYNIVHSTKNEPRLELILCRPLSNDGNDDFLNFRRLRDPGRGVQLAACGAAEAGSSLPHSQSLITGASPFGAAHRYPRRAPSPLVLQAAAAGAGGSTMAANYFEPMPTAAAQLPFAAGAEGAHSMDSRVCGRLEMALLFLVQKRELIISLSRAYDLLPRADGSLRNPYVKLFLLPDRSERSRRQSKVFSDTLVPVWDEHFFYDDLTEMTLSGRVLEVTLWDYDPYESHSFLGETLIELAQAPLNNQPYVYTLLDMDDENPIRMRIRQRRFSSMTPPVGQRSRSQMSYSGQHSMGASNEERAIGGYERGGGRNNSHSMQNLPHYLSRRGWLGIGNEAAFWQTAEEEDCWNRNGGGILDEDVFEGWEGAAKLQQKRGGGRMPNGYLSDQEHEWEADSRGRRERDQQQHHRRREHRHQHHRGGGGGGAQRRPQSATALRNIAEWEMRHQQQQGAAGTEGGSQEYYESPAEGDRGGGDGRAARLVGGGGGRRTTRQQELREQEGGAGGGGYGSDGSVETLSVNSAQSMQNRALLRQQHLQRIRDQQQNTQSSTEDNNDARGGHHQMSLVGIEDEEEERVQEQAIGGPKGQAGGLSAREMKERKKSLMTRLIPGRNGPNDASKRLGFARSEEVGIPEALAPPDQNRDFIKQNSKESTDSSTDNWLPIFPDRPLGSFMDNLGPGQVVGRQALGSSPLGELHVVLTLETGGGLSVDIREAKGLTLKQNTKGVPAIYVKAYLMEAKSCVAKAKTQPIKTRASSIPVRQKLMFAESPRQKMLQLTVIGDYGRMERKAFLGVVQIALDELQLCRGDQNVDGFFKLFHSASLNGSAGPPPAGGGGPSRKDSEVSLN